MKKETLEEAAKRIYPINIVSSDGYDGNFLCRIGFYIGYELAQERSYSEDDLREAFKQSREAFIFEKDMPCVYDSFEEWFKQFKKK